MRALCRFTLAIVASVGAAWVSAAADDDHDRAREAVAAGHILPLSAIIERAVQRFGGNVLDVEYEDDDEHGGNHGRTSSPRYEVKLLTADGRILKLDYDAASGELIGERRRMRTHQGRGHDDDGDE